jgi:hypothetical protein
MPFVTAQADGYCYKRGYVLADYRTTLQSAEAKAEREGENTTEGLSC